MPNPLEALRNARSIGDPWATQEVTRSEMPIAPGGGAGIMEGLKNLFSFSPGSLGTMEKMYQQANPAFRALEGSGTFAGPRTALGMGSAAGAAPGASQVASRAPVAAAETLGEQNPYYTASGGEGMYNAGKKAVSGITDPIQSAYTSLLQRGGR